jgi:hypothetical protein
MQIVAPGAVSLPREKAIEYLRFSDAVQALGDSKRRQRDLNAEYAACHNLEIVESFEDLGISAFKGRNAKIGAFKALNDMAEKQLFQNSGIRHVIVEAFDRLSRMTLDEAYQQFRTLIHSGMTVHIRTLSTAYDKASLNDPQKLMGALMFMGLAHQESALKAGRLGEVRARDRIKAREGLKEMTTVAPYWLEWNEDYEWKGKKPWFKPIEERVETVRLIYEMAAEGASIYYIHRRLNELRRPTFRTGKGAAKNGWSTSTVSKILKSEAVLGTMQPCKLDEMGKSVPEGEPILEYYEPIISVDLYNRAQAAKRPPNHSQGRTGKAYTNLLKGKLHCGCCSTADRLVTMQIRPSTRQSKNGSKTYNYLHCTAKRNAGAPDHPRNFNYDQLEKLVLDHIQDLDLSKVVVRRSGADEFEGLKVKIAEVEYRLKSLRMEEANLGKQIDGANTEEKSDYLWSRIQKKLVEIDTSETELRVLKAQLGKLKFKESRRHSVEAVEQLKAEMEGAAGHELYGIRERLAGALQSMIDDIRFYPQTNDVDVIVLGGVRAHRFNDGKLVASVDLVPQVQQGVIPVEAFPTNQQELARILDTANDTDGLSLLARG